MLRHLSCLGVLMFSAPAAIAQITHVSPIPVNGDDAGDQLGKSVSGAGDVNNDGFDDYIVGASSDDNNGADAGSARVYSGVDGSILYTFYGDAAGDAFGGSVSGAGDVNNDGFADVIVGAVSHNSSRGRARVFSGANGAILYTFTGSAVGDQLGSSVSGAGDVNNDGFDDVIVGLPGRDINGSGSGTARVYSGATGLIIWAPNGDSAFDQFGKAVSGAGDVDNDGFDDFIVGAPEDGLVNPTSGSARVFSGATGQVLHLFYGASGNFGAAVSGAGDVNNDGFDDVVVGSPFGIFNGIGSGYATVHSGADGSTLYTFHEDTANDFFGDSVSGAGDVNGDGYADLIVGARMDDPNGVSVGSASVFCGQTGATLYTWHGEASGGAGNFGFSVSGAGDLNNDGYADLIVGAPYHDTHAVDDGRFRVFFSIPTCAACPGNANNDTIVNFDDITEVLANWQSVCP